MTVKDRKNGFTVVELLTVVSIIAMLVALLIPAVTMVRSIAKETQQKGQFTSISLALGAFRNDYGDFPPSDWRPGEDYCGAQKLAEALMGWDLMGFHPETEWESTGNAYDPSNPSEDNLRERRGPYLDTGRDFACKLDDLFEGSSTAPLEPDTYVLCDVFHRKKVKVGTDSNGDPVIEQVGMPILYYRANPASRRELGDGPADEQIYNPYHNLSLVGLGRIEDGEHHEDFDDPSEFYEYIRDPKITKRDWPYRPDSFILISAGSDGLYGTEDDVTNFGQ